jgi:hypothetical protein
MLDWIRLLIADDLDAEDLRRDPRQTLSQAPRRAAEERAGHPPVRAAGLHGAAGLKARRCAAVKPKPPFLIAIQ